MNISTVKRQVIRAYIFLIVNALVNLTFVLSTIGFLVLLALSLMGSEPLFTRIELFKLYSLVFFARFVWTICYHFARKRIQKQFEEAGVNIPFDGTGQVTGIINVLTKQTDEVKKEKEAILAKYRANPEKAKRELVLLHMKHGGRNES